MALTNSRVHQVANNISLPEYLVENQEDYNYILFLKNSSNTNYQEENEFQPSENINDFDEFSFLPEVNFEQDNSLNANTQIFQNENINSKAKSNINFKLLGLVAAIITVILLLCLIIFLVVGSSSNNSTHGIQPEIKNQIPIPTKEKPKNSINGIIGEKQQIPLDQTEPDLFVLSYYSAFFSKNLEDVIKAYDPNGFIKSKAMRKALRANIYSNTMFKRNTNFSVLILTKENEGNKVNYHVELVYNKMKHVENLTIKKIGGLYYLDSVRNTQV